MNHLPIQFGHILDKKLDYPDLVAFCDLILQFGQVFRATMDSNGNPESDTTHTVMLAMLVLCTAGKEKIPLKIDLCLGYALVHDLAEAKAGDTPTLIELTPEQQALKDAKEAKARKQIREELSGFPVLLQLLDAYETQEDPEAKFVKVLDKILPKLTHSGNGYRVPLANGFTKEAFAARLHRQAEMLKKHAPELEYAHSLYRFTSDHAIQNFPEDTP